MKILIPTIMYKRHKVFDVFAQGIINLQKAFPEHEIKCLVVGSGDKEAVDKYDFEYIDYPNEPLSAKADYRLSLCRDKADYYLFLGSDDIIDVKTFAYYLARIDEGYDWIAPYDLCLWNNGDIYYSEGYKPTNPRYMESLAVGRCCSNSLLNDCNWSLWSEIKDKNIDRQAYLKLNQKSVKEHFFRLQDTGGCIYDLKTGQNISVFTPENHILIGKDHEYMDNNLLPLLDIFKKDIHSSVVIYPNVELGGNIQIQAGTVLGVPGMIRGSKEFKGRLIIGNNVIIGANVTIAIGTAGDTIVGNNCLIMNNALIGHNVQIGDNCEIGAGVNICGHAKINDKVRLKTGVNVRNRIEIAEGVTVGMGSNVLKDLKISGLTMVGNPCEEIIV